MCVKVKLYQSLILPILLCSAELWPITVTFMKKLDAEHRIWQRKLLGVTGKDNIKGILHVRGCVRMIAGVYTGMDRWMDGWMDGWMEDQTKKITNLTKSVMLYGCR